MMEKFYPVLPDADWIERLVPLGIKQVQLRFKSENPQDIGLQIARAAKVCRDHNVQLIVNDHWQLAIEAGCDFIHLGQDDMALADFDRIRAAGLRYGLSTHDRKELACALALKPAYVALGPVYETRLKKMKWRPQGLQKLAHWRELAKDTPLVAIGGLTVERLPGLWKAGADCAAVVTDLVTAPDPVARTKEWVQACR